MRRRLHSRSRGRALMQKVQKVLQKGVTRNLLVHPWTTPRAWQRVGDSSPLNQLVAKGGVEPPTQGFSVGGTGHPATSRRFPLPSISGSCRADVGNPLPGTSRICPRFHGAIAPKLHQHPAALSRSPALHSLRSPPRHAGIGTTVSQRPPRAECSRSPAAAALLLNWRALHGAEGAEHATVPRLGA